MSTLYWIRRDFRLDDNPALVSALNHQCKRAVYMTAYQTWQTHNLSSIQADLIERHINWMAAQLAELGIELTVIECNTYHQQVEQLLEFCNQYGIKHVFANSEPEIREQTRDQKVKEAITLTLSEADTILPAGSVINKQGQMFKVFTPFKKAWVGTFMLYGIEQRYLGAINQHISPSKSHSISFNYPKQDSSKWPLAETVLSQVLPEFIESKMHHYAEERDIPAIKGTSGLSAYLAIGAISPKRLLIEALNRYPSILNDIKSPLFSWVNELIWRDFYRHLIAAFPELCKLRDFQSKFADFYWPNDEAKFKAWCEGKTGFPIVDAAMRQLRNTGWMHNRLRMITASFLTKHLLIDWRKGEAFFMQHLIDGDLAANSGGWQWAAGTGCDAQPYFRIFNPISQSEKFDPDGSFIRKFLPELKNVPAKYIHQPQEYLASLGSDKYWPTIVDLKIARQQALDYYQQELNK